MFRAIRIHDYGGPEVLKLEALPTPVPGPGEILIRQEAMGVNFIDTYFRKGLYKLPTLPAVLGMEGAGVIEAVGADVTDMVPGDRVAYPTALGGYAEVRTIAADRVVPLPPFISSEVAAGVMLRGLTVHALLREVYDVKPGETILVHAAAGGVGLLMCQWGRHLGARVIGVVSTEEKAELALQNGAADVLVGHDNLPARVRKLTDGAMVPVVYDSIGKDTFVASLDCLAPRGLMVSYGNASGEVTGVSVGMLATRGSLYLTRPGLTTYIAQRSALLKGAEELFGLIGQGVLSVRIGQRFALADAADAHRALEARVTTGSTILLP
ncbi:quinone oxidoreductase [Gluconacetobacter azotocaptans]|uniref:Quinone oxidoreductase n=1 Tax=Gluconacetobacter azotocaptans TaxID=142834 RepID=A0A7W4JR16_9PROT|nr:quinone oxidoreductase [Gluconacetobacter azotocaptans]MBB2189332.1 quinone oxidoreductase [Gluconacetobacter azotocaptans]MBM9401273.1 quinone oxidoreductase [Gluconacetobacter azotocaptans]GBQ28635.1 zinc-dependent alcohol dehydrogenase [Gluconacetobacter azotocaptans DSM 13594]